MILSLEMKQKNIAWKVVRIDNGKLMSLLFGENNVEYIPNQFVKESKPSGFGLWVCSTRKFARRIKRTFEFCNPHIDYQLWKCEIQDAFKIPGVMHVKSVFADAPGVMHVKAVKLLNKS